MAYDPVDLGSAPNDGTGDDLRTGGGKINAMLSELYTLVAALGGQAKAPVRAASTANGTLATDFENGDTLDGVTLATGDRILLKNQSAGAENGIYIVAASGAPARATDAGSSTELVNAAVWVSEGTANADHLYVCTTNAPITVDTTALTWVNPFAAAATTFATAAEFRAGDEAAKALSPDNVFDAAAFVALTDGATVTPDFDAGFNFTWTIAGNRTLANPSNAKEGQTGCIQITQDGTGTRLISAYGNQYRFAGGTDIVLSTAAGTVDLLFYVVLPGPLVFLTAQKAIAA